MKVKYPKAHTFADVKPGDVFMYTNAAGTDFVFIRPVSVKDEQGIALNAVRVDNGAFDSFKRDTPVVILKGTFVVGE